MTKRRLAESRSRTSDLSVLMPSVCHYTTSPKKPQCKKNLVTCSGFNDYHSELLCSEVVGFSVFILILACFYRLETEKSATQDFLKFKEEEEEQQQQQQRHEKQEEEEEKQQQQQQRQHAKQEEEEEQQQQQQKQLAKQEEEAEEEQQQQAKQEEEEQQQQVKQEAQE
ncbi:hypothetical protein ElyMa_006454500 [Elysia marginata]|uniref:Uncharacterized protein n=1 Tax=Elysia marginata TaxID=1093978 RepID=A0AAV4I1K9_9GAST|nr:hypothetical protein ElyMa_006454500 [Elysia marginata]